MPTQEPTFRKTISRAQRIVRAFASHDAKPWAPEIKAVDLQVHVGALAQAVLEQGGFKPTTEVREQLGSELATILFILLDIAEVYNIDFEQAFDIFLTTTERQFKKGSHI